MSHRRVVITGLGIISPVGSTVDDAWASIVNGKSGIREITRFDVSRFPTRFGGSVQGFDVNDYIAPKDSRKIDVFIHYGIAASMQAIADSGIEVSDANASRIGVAVGAGIGGLSYIETTHKKYLDADGNPRKISPFFVPGTIINMISGHVSIKYGLKGPNLSLVTACTTGTHSIGIGMRTIQYGDADMMIVGGAEMATTPLGLGGFCSARALSTRNDDPQAASRPWDVDRDGFVLGDGAGVLVLEEYEHAKARGADIYAELIGFGMSGDAFHITAPLESGEGAQLCMENAIRDAGINAEDVQYVNAHGTSTPLGDKAETLAIRKAFGNAADKLAVSSTKSMTGHLLGAAGGVEALICVMALRDQVLPPTINLDNQDPECNLDFVPNTARETAFDVALSSSFGFGGTNGTLVMRKAP